MENQLTKKVIQATEIYFAQSILTILWTERLRNEDILKRLEITRRLLLAIRKRTGHIENIRSRGKPLGVSLISLIELI